MLWQLLRDSPSEHEMYTGGPWFWMDAYIDMAAYFNKLGDAYIVMAAYFNKLGDAYIHKATY